MSVIPGSVVALISQPAAARAAGRWLSGAGAGVAALLAVIGLLGFSQPVVAQDGGLEACGMAPEVEEPAGRGGGRGGRQGGPNRRLGGVLGGVPLTPADCEVVGVVSLLEFESYKDILEGLAQFGDRQQGTERNAQAVDWIEAELRSWGYETGRVQYMYNDEPREEVYATKVGATNPDEMYIIGAHMDGRGGGEAVNDDGSGTALVMEIARVLADPQIQSDRSIRFALWNNEETGLQGARAYVDQRAPLQGIEDPPGSGRYPEPRWMGMIQHDMMMWDHGNPVTYDQALDADVDIEFQLNSEMAEGSARLALQLLNANRKFATDYPAVMSNAMSNTDSTPFMDLIPAVSLRENRRLYETGNGANPHWHRPTDLFVTFSDADFRLGFNAAQTTLGAIAELAGVQPPAGR